MSGEIIELLVGIALAFIPFVIYLIAKKYPPKNINSFYGYRTNRSMKNVDTWQEANTYTNRLFVPVGILTLITVLISAILPGVPLGRVTTITTCVLVTLSLSILGITEWHLYKTFDENGNKR